MILLIDSYDSFANNLRRLISSSVDKQVVVIANDTYSPEEYPYFFKEVLPSFEYIVIGPGPGHPENAEDVGIIPALFQHLREHPVPLLGICLGFQCLCHEFGNRVSRLSSVKHGQVYDVDPIESELFDAGVFPSVRYHSLYVKDTNEHIVPLAYTADEARILMAAKHHSLPFYGVQYHPESVCSAKGAELATKFDAIASTFNAAHRPTLPPLTEDICRRTAKRELVTKLVAQPARVAARKLQLAVKPIDVCDHLEKHNTPFVLLSSASVPGEWLIIGLPTEASEVITHSVDDGKVVVKQGETTTVVEGDVWTYVGGQIRNKHVPRASLEAQLGGLHSRPLPFFGGYLGVFSYEEGQHIVLDNLESLCTGPTPDTKLVFVERFVVYDHTTDDFFVVAIGDDAAWVDSFSTEIAMVRPLDLAAIPSSVGELTSGKISYDFPDKHTYTQQFDECQRLLHSGDSYELCLTTLLKITIPKDVSAWDIYKVLTVKNPLPYSCFMAFDDVTLISSSPERFLSWKDGEQGKRVELRPIKGTVKNTPDVDVAAATAILKTPKEMGENLMIVDLIRHDLHEFIDDVQVSQLMAVEEYKSVYQLVSVIGGEITDPSVHGFDILHVSLPPGSMTGAPKKRSVHLLQDIESRQKNGNVGGRRGIYSGVVGYWSVTDDADWLVVIRSLFHYKNDKLNTPGGDVWRIGAGGAITVLSDVHGEWDEMRVKLASALQAITG